MKYHIARGAEQLGAFSDLEVSSGMRDGRFQPTDLCWTEGMPAWQTLDERMRAIAAETGQDEPAPPPLPAASFRVPATPEAALATLGQRLGAYLIDMVLMLIPAMLMFSALMDAELEAEINANAKNPQAVVEALQRQIEKMSAAGDPTVMAASLVILGLTVCNVILLTLRGQSLGKLMLRIQIVRFADGARAGFLKAVILRGLLFAVIGNIAFIGPVILLADVLLIFRQDRRCLHDLVADTKVTRLPG